MKLSNAIWAVLCMSALAACVDSKCPAGSEEVNGNCMTIEADGGPNGSGSADGNGSAGSSGGDAGSTGAVGMGNASSTGDASTGDAGTGDDGTGDAGTGDGGTGDTGTGDAGTGPVKCGDLTCGQNAHCDPTSGTDARCACDNGYEGDGQTCDDIDECSAGSHDCHDDATCTNVPAGFTCECDPGFEGDGKSCTANPCEPRVDPCDADTTTCRDDAGMAVCDCLPGRGRCDDALDECSTDLTTDTKNCGECDFACAGNLACEAAECGQKVIELELGARHSCALAPDGEILCWGRNDLGQLGRPVGSTAPLHEPTATPFGPARLLSAGPDVSCAVLKAQDELVCFGDNLFDWIDATANVPDVYRIAAGLVSVADLEVGITHACLLGGAQVNAWGVDTSGMLGHDELTRVPYDTLVRTATDVATVAAGATDCVIGEDGCVRCWGNGTTQPTAVLDGAGACLEEAIDVAVAAQGYTQCAVLADGSAWCVGDNSSGQLGNPAVLEATSPVAVAVNTQSSNKLGGLTQIAVGTAFACALHEDGRVFCWGRSDRLGSGASGTSAQRYATPVMGVDDAIEVAAGSDHACIRRRSGQVQCWGDSADGKLGVSAPANGTQPVNVIGLP